VLGRILLRQASLRALLVPAATSSALLCFTESLAASGWSYSKKPFPSLHVSRFCTIRAYWGVYER